MGEAERDFCLKVTHRGTYLERYVVHVPGVDGGHFCFVSNRATPTEFTMLEAYDAMEMLECRYSDVWSFEVIHMECVY